MRHGNVSYLVRWRDTVGAQRSRSFDREVDATAYEAEINRQRRLGTLVDAASAKTTVDEFADIWLGWQLQLKPKTLASYRSLLDSQVLPTWRDIRLDEVDHASVSEWVSELCRRPGRGGERLSPSRVRQAYHLFTGMLDGAVAARWLAANPARGVALPALENRKTPRALSHDEVADLADGCGPHRSMVLLMAYTGLRWGEVAGLRAGAVHIDRAERSPQLRLGTRVGLLVAQTVVDVNGRLGVSTPKAHQRRWVDVPAFLEEDLIQRIAARTPDELVFPSRTGGPLRVGNFRRDWFDSAACAARQPGLTPHDLRHTAAVLALDSGATIEDIRVMLGHKDEALILRRYGNRDGQHGARITERLSLAAEEATERRRQRRHVEA